MNGYAPPTRGPLAGAGAVFWREMLLLRRRSHRYVASMAVSPLLYMTAFAYAVGRGVEVDGRPYAAFLIPGLAAMSAMMQSFSIGSEINVARFYWKLFEEFQCAPMTDLAYALGEVSAGAVRGMLAVLVIILVGLPFGVVLHYGPWFWLAVALNSLAFASLGTGLAMIVRGHQDQMLLQTFVITPMAFLGGNLLPGGQAARVAGAGRRPAAPDPRLEGHARGRLRAGAVRHIPGRPRDLGPGLFPAGPPRRAQGARLTPLSTHPRGNPCVTP